MTSPGAGTASAAGLAAFFASRALRALRSLPFLGALKVDSLVGILVAQGPKNRPLQRRRIETMAEGCQRPRPQSGLVSRVAGPSSPGAGVQCAYPSQRGTESRISGPIGWGERRGSSSRGRGAGTPAARFAWRAGPRRAPAGFGSLSGTSSPSTSEKRRLPAAAGGGTTSPTRRARPEGRREDSLEAGEASLVGVAHAAMSATTRRARTQVPTVASGEEGAGRLGRSGDPSSGARAVRTRRPRRRIPASRCGSSRSR